MSGKAMAATIAALAFGCLLAIGVLFATGAQAQESPCAGHDIIAKQLADRFNEMPIVRALINEKMMTERYASVDGTWTDVLTNEQGQSCIVAFGTALEFDTTAFDKAKKGRAL